jgi:hypothetical protein
MSNRNLSCLAPAARRRKVWLGWLAFSSAFCGGPGPVLSGDSTNLPPVLPPPEFMGKKPPLPDLLLKDKRSGRYATGIPIIGWDPETGFNYGAAVQWFDNGPADSPFFRYTPYHEQVAVGAAGSTGGSYRALLAYDRPYFGDSPWRLRVIGGFERNNRENYFGIGESTLGPLTYPGPTLTSATSTTTRRRSKAL